MHQYFVLLLAVAAVSNGFIVVQPTQKPVKSVENFELEGFLGLAAKPKSSSSVVPGPNTIVEAVGDVEYVASVAGVNTPRNKPTATVTISYNAIAKPGKSFNVYTKNSSGYVALKSIDYQLDRNNKREYAVQGTKKVVIPTAQQNLPVPMIDLGAITLGNSQTSIVGDLVVRPTATLKVKQGAEIVQNWKYGTNLLWQAHLPSRNVAY